MSRTLRRSPSRPLTDISNLVVERSSGPTPVDYKAGLAPPSSSPLVDLPHTDSPPFTPTLDAVHTLDSTFDSDDDDIDLEPPRPFRTSFESRQWKECTPILDDPVGEALAEQSCAASPMHTVTYRAGQPVDDDHTASSGDEASGDELDISSMRSRSTLDEDGASTVTTPDTSMPTSSSPWSERCDPHGELAALDLERSVRIGAATSTSTSTPPRPAGRFVELVETCPTPPSRAKTSARSRSLLVVASGLGISSTSGSDDDDGEALPSGPCSRNSSRTPSRSRERTRSSSAHSSRSPSPDLAERSPVPRLEPGDASSYTPSLYPDAAHYDTYTRRPRLRRSLTRIFAPEEDGDEQQQRDALAFPPAEALVADLLRSHTSERAARRGAWNGDEALEPLRHVRPLSTPGLDDGSAPRRSSASPTPFSSLVSPQHLHHAPHPSYGAPSPRLAPRHQPSTSTLLTYDLSHLPAPNSPRERPYRVSWGDVVRPSAFVRAGRGSGRCGDVWGAALTSETQGRRWSWRGKAAAPPALAQRPLVGAHGPLPRSTPSRLDEFAVVGAPAPAHAARAGLTRSGSLASVRRGLSKLGRRMSWGARAGADDAEVAGHDEHPLEVKAQRRKSLAASFFGVSWEAEHPSIEELDQWVAVVVR
ncbi:hypothetical protein JCM9279_000585 [Rhodotorula babjevae]